MGATNTRLGQNICSVFVNTSFNKQCAQIDSAAMPAHAQNDSWPSRHKHNDWICRIQSSMHIQRVVIRQKFPLFCKLCALYS